MKGIPLAQGRGGGGGYPSYLYGLSFPVAVL